MNNINALKISILLGSLITIYACKKSSSPGNQGQGKGKTCYVKETNLTQGSSTTKTQYTYNDDHSLASGSIIYNGGPNGAFYKFSKPSDHEYRMDGYMRTNGVPDKHSEYYIYFLNTSNKADSSYEYGCVDCELDEPTQFAIKSVTIYHYDAAGNPIHTDGRDDGGEYNGHTELQYDSKGRLSGSIDIDESDDTVDTIIYTYAASDSENFSTGEPTAVQKIIFGHSMEYAPLSITTQLYSISSSTKIDYKNTGNADGYLVSSTATVGGVNGRTTTYTYDCVDK